MWEYMEKNRRGIIGTTIFHVVVALIIIFLGFSTPLPLPGEEGIIINFGTDEEGLGFTQPARQQASPPPPPPPVQTQTETPVITQDYEEAPSLPQPRREEVRQPEPPTPVQETRPEPVQEPPAEEVAEVAPERRPNPNALFPGRASTGDTGTSEGETAGPGNQGRETGAADSPHREGGDSGSPDGVTYSLAGRNPLSLPLPEYTHQVEGVVVVEVTVNRNGDVTAALAPFRGSTTMDNNLAEAARRAALRAKFNVRADAPAFQKGTITYRFRLQ
jgi:colicin import membrane protein